MNNFLKVLVLFSTLLFSMLCCVSSLPGTPAVESTPTVTVVPQPPAPSISPAPILPTDTFTPLTPTNTAAPTSLNAMGPYVLFKGLGGVWITNPDGSFPTRISNYEIQGIIDIRRTISPAGDRMALVIQNDQGLDLVLVNIPGGETETIAHLISVTSPSEFDSLTPKGFAVLAIRDYDSVAWQPGNGRLLAFIGAINGPTADLYLYDSQTKEIKQLTSGPSQAILPSWSPDGQFILNYGVSWVPPFGGGIGTANQLDGVWAVHVSDGKVIPLPKPSGMYPHFVSWQDASHYVTYDSNDECTSKNLRTVDVATGKTKLLMENSFYSYVAQSPENGALLFSSAAGCPTSLGDGTFLLLPGQTTPTKILDKTTWEIDWLPESRVFFAYPEALISSDGNTSYSPPVYDSSFDPAISMLGYQAWKVYINTVAHVMVKISSGDWQDILNGSVSQLIWDPITGKTLLITLEDGSLYVASAPDFTPRLMGNLGGSMDQAIWLP